MTILNGVMLNGAAEPQAYDAADRRYQPISGVNPNIYAPYRFEDHIWNLPAHRKDDLLELAERCVKFDKNYWLKMPNSTNWESYGTIADAKKEAKNQWMFGVLRSGSIVDADLIDTFFDGTELQTAGKKSFTVDVGSCPYTQGRMVIPLGPQFLKYRGRKYLNSSTVEILRGDPHKLKEGKIILSMIYRSLCDGEELHPNKLTEADMLLHQIITNTYTNQDFRFVMNWLAALAQRPGINLQTNLWFVGDLQGIGKGTLTTIMKHILGFEAVGNLNQAEIEAGWNDHLFGLLLVVVNEFDSSGKFSPKAWDKWIKAHTCEPEFSIRQRNVTSWSTLNVGNYIFTTNELIPLYLDKTDRRNQIIKGTTDPYWRDWASVVQTQYVIPDPHGIASGFAAVLEQVQVDLNFIKSAYINQAKADIQEASTSKADEWVRNDPTISRGVWFDDVRALYEKFKGWHEIDHPGERPQPRNGWSRDMKKVSCVEHLTAGSFDDTGTKHRTPAFRINEIGERVVSKRDDVVRDFAVFTDDHISSIPDQDVKSQDGYSDMERLREHLRRNGATDDPYPSMNGRGGVN